MTPKAHFVAWLALCTLSAGTGFAGEDDEDSLAPLAGPLVAMSPDDSIDTEGDGVEPVAFHDEELTFSRPEILATNQVAEATGWHWTDSLEVFAGLEGSKQPQDFGVNAQFGGRAHVNWAMPLFEDRGIGLQIGTSIVQTHHAVAVTSAIEGSTRRTQNFSTFGLFQRTESGWTWGAAYDLLVQDDYDAVTLSQWRGRVGYDLGCHDEVGIMGMVPQSGSDATWAGGAVRLTPLAQGSVYWRHQWEFGGQTTGWLGAAESHGQANAALGDRDSTGPVPVFGADVHMPLNNHWALFGEANFVTPADTGTVDAYLGLAYYPGAGAVLWRRRAFSPVLPVASNSSFSTNLTR